MTPLWAQTMAAYGRWMNGNLIEKANLLSDELRQRDLGAFFKSIHATLDHINVGDFAWIARFDGGEKLGIPFGQLMDADWASLQARRASLDARIKAWVDQVSAAELAAPMTFASMIDGRERSLPRWVLAAQMFNHGTHHRGQVTTLLSQQGIDPGTTDLPWCPALYDNSLPALAGAINPPL